MTSEATVDHAKYDALTAHIARSDMRNFRKRTGGESSRVSAIKNAIVSTFAVTFAAIGLVVVVFSILVMGAAGMYRIQADSNRGFVVTAGTTALMVAILTGCTALSIWVTRLIADILIRDSRFSAGWRRRFRLHRFAVDNGLSYAPEVENPSRSGVIFTAGTSRKGLDILSAGPRSDFEIGNYQYAGSWKSERALRRFGYFRLRLPGPLPHIVLEARRNRRWFGRSNLPWRFASAQSLSLEGDFDRYFRLHVPVGHEQNALYIFTPDLMVLFMDRAADFDVEIVDDWMYVYSPKPFRMLDSNTYERLFAVLDTVGRKTFERSAKYTRHQPLAVYRSRSRLVRNVRVGPIVIAAVYLCLLVFRLISTLS
jgi:hypothetical protein